MGYEVLGTGDETGPQQVGRGSGTDAGGGGGGGPGVAEYDLGDAGPREPARSGSTTPLPPGRTHRRLALAGTALVLLIGAVGLHQSAGLRDTGSVSTPTPSATGQRTHLTRSRSGQQDLATPVSVLHVRLTGPVTRQLGAVSAALQAGALTAAYDVRPDPLGAGSSGQVGVVVEFDRALSAAQQAQAEVAVMRAGPGDYSGTTTQAGLTVSIAVPTGTGAACVRGTGFNTVLTLTTQDVDQVAALLAPVFTSFTTDDRRAVIHYTGPTPPLGHLEAVGGVLARACGRAPADVTFTRGPVP